MKHTTPPPDKYQIPSDNSLFKRNVISVLYKEKKFFTQKNMPKIKAQVPIQYTSQDGVGPEGENLSAHNRGSQLSGYVGGSNTSIYR
jgi:hypothetical protein